MSDIAIRVDGLSKQYRIGGRQQASYKTIRETVMDTVKAPFRRAGKLLRGQAYGAAEMDETIWALKDVSFEVERGDVLGIIGRNGAGKTTLLKVLSRITDPTEGRAEIHGRVGSLLEVGTGFHPELTGRENIYLNGAILGMRRDEIERKFDEIVGFSGVEKFIDTPVKHYSSGMRVRLAFSVAAHLDPEILLIDEVLAVGDAAFQKKCLGKMGDVASEGRTVLFVSHQMDMIRALCDWCMLLDQGQVRSNGDPEKVIGEYVASFSSRSQAASFEVEEDESLALQVTRGRITDETGQVRDHFDVFDQIILELEYVVHRAIIGAIVNFELKRNGSTLFFSFDSDTVSNRLDRREPGIYRCCIELPCPLLKPGYYQITPGTGVANRRKIQHLEDVLSFRVDLLSKPSTFLSYAAKRAGSIAVPLDWKVISVD